MAKVRERWAAKEAQRMERWNGRDDKGPDDKGPDGPPPGEGDRARYKVAKPGAYSNGLTVAL